MIGTLRIQVKPEEIIEAASLWGLWGQVLNLSISLAASSRFYNRYSGDAVEM